MHNRSTITKMALAGSAAGVINGLFGAGGGMVLVPLLTSLSILEDREVFPASVSIILPICIVTLWIGSQNAPLPWIVALPYLIGSVIGGVASGWIGNKIPTLWLHRLLGILILYGGWRYLC